MFLKQTLTREILHIQVHTHHLVDIKRIQHHVFVDYEKFIKKGNTHPLKITTSSVQKHSISTLDLIKARKGDYSPVMQTHGSERGSAHLRQEN